MSIHIGSNVNIGNNNRIGSTNIEGNVNIGDNNHIGNIKRNIIVNFDGGCKGNPGPMTSKVVIQENGKVIKEVFDKYPHGTNNQAEYIALDNALYALIGMDIKDSDINIFGDSKLVILQVKGEWSVSSPDLLDYYNSIKERAKKLKSSGNVLSITWVPRKKNAIADKLKGPRESII